MQQLQEQGGVPRYAYEGDDDDAAEKQEEQSRDDDGDDDEEQRIIDALMIGQDDA